MENSALLKLGAFIDEHFSDEEFWDIGFFSKDIKVTDYEKIAERVCTFFGYKSIYEYNVIKYPSLLSMGNENDVCGMESGYSVAISPNVDMGNPINWNKLETPEMIDLISKDKYLN